MIHRSLIYTGQLPQEPYSDVLNSCCRLLAENFDSEKILGINLFIHSASHADFHSKRLHIIQRLRTVYTNTPLCILAQPSESQIAAEVWTDDSETAQIEHKSTGGQYYTVLSNEMGKFLFALGITLELESDDPASQAHFAFEKMEHILKCEAFCMDEVIRQWNYIPEILNQTTIDGKKHQHYQLFNDIRQHYYSLLKKDKQYPSATGIGVKHGNTTIDFLAFKPNSGMQCSCIANPRQIDAFEYSQSLLVGETSDKKPPLFARAKQIGGCKNTQVFVSGTASIIGEQTCAIGDINRQTTITIDNIQELVKTDENCINPTGKSTVKNMFNRVYIKNISDFGSVKEICTERYPNTTTLYVQADVCRDNLLVEIESEFAIHS